MLRSFRASNAQSGVGTDASSSSSSSRAIKKTKTGAAKAKIAALAGRGRAGIGGAVGGSLQAAPSGPQRQLFTVTDDDGVQHLVGQTRKLPQCIIIGEWRDVDGDVESKWRKLKSDRACALLFCVCVNNDKRGLNCGLLFAFIGFLHVFNCLLFCSDGSVSLVRSFVRVCWSMCQFACHRGNSWLCIQMCKSVSRCGGSHDGFTTKHSDSRSLVNWLKRALIESDFVFHFSILPLH